MNKKRVVLCYVGYQHVGRGEDGFEGWDKNPTCVVFDFELKNQAIQLKEILLKDKWFKDVFLSEEIT